MSREYVAAVSVSLKPGVLDPQGRAVCDGLRALGFDGVGDVRVGKRILVRLRAPDAAQARASASEMCRRLLANPVTETYEVEVTPA